MNRVGTASFRRVEDAIDVKIALRGGSRPYGVRFVSEAHVLGISIRLRKNRDGRDFEFAAGTHDAYRDLASIGYENLSEHEALRDCSSAADCAESRSSAQFT